MISREPLTVTLGGRSFTIAPLTVGQVERIGNITATIDQAAPYTAIVETVQVALSRANPAVVVRDLDGVDGAELSTAYRAILAHGGFRPAGERTAPAANTGTSTTESASA